MMFRLGIHHQPQAVTLKNADNLHRIAIGNLQDKELALRKWWHRKYKVPPKPLDEYTLEELYVEHLEDFYDKNPKAGEDFLRKMMEIPDWDGELSPEQEAKNKTRAQRLSAKLGHDITKYQTKGDEDLSDEVVQAILDGLGRDLPGSRVKPKAGMKAMVEGALGDFDENFGE